MATNTRFNVKNPHFAYFLRGHPGLRLREDVEKKVGVKIEILNNADEVLVHGGDSEKMDAVKNELREGWHLDDYQKAKEIFDLMGLSPCHDIFSVPIKHVSSLIGHYGRRVAGLESRTNASIKIDCVGNVSVFGTKENCDRAKFEVGEWIKHENGEKSIFNGQEFDDPRDDVGHQTTTAYAGQNQLNGPTLLTFWVPSRGAALIIGRHGQNVIDFEKQYRCMIDLRTSEENSEGMVPVDITAKESKTAYKAKDELLKFLDRFFPSKDSKDWADAPVTVCQTGGPPPEKQATGAKGVTRLTFTVAEEHAPRLIGTRGVNKKRLEERTDCCLILRTEERRNNIFPVDVIGRNKEECENAKAKIQAFLNERPTTATPPKRGRQPPPSLGQQRFRSRSEPEESPEKSSSDASGSPITWARKVQEKPREKDPGVRSKDSPPTKHKEATVVWERQSSQNSADTSPTLETDSVFSAKTKSDLTEKKPTMSSDLFGYMPAHFQSFFGPLIPEGVKSPSSKITEDVEGHKMLGAANCPIGSRNDGQKRVFVPDRLEAEIWGDFLDQMNNSGTDYDEKGYPLLGEPLGNLLNQGRHTFSEQNYFQCQPSTITPSREPKGDPVTLTTTEL